MTEAIVVALIGLAAGALGSLVAPWAQWGLEQKRERLAHRRALVGSWRDGVATWEAETGDGPLPYVEPSYLQARWYSTLRPHVAAEVRDRVEGGHLPLKATWREGERVYGNAPMLYDEIARIERGWGLT